MDAEVHGSTCWESNRLMGIQGADYVDQLNFEVLRKILVVPVVIKKDGCSTKWFGIYTNKALILPELGKSFPDCHEQTAMEVHKTPTKQK